MTRPLATWRPHHPHQSPILDNVNKTKASGYSYDEDFVLVAANTNYTVSDE